MRLLNFIFGFVLIFLSFYTNAQQVDSIARRNTIKLDMTSYWLYRNAAVLSYERIVKPNQSWCVTGGLQQLALLNSISSTRVKRDIKATGFKFGAEYRFYLQKENKYPAPRGVYIGPYVTFLNFANKRIIELDNNGVTETGEMSSKINILNLGFQLGYQFLVNDRWTFDLVFVGPSFSNYRAAVSLDENFNIDPDDITNDFYEALIKRFPGFNDLITGNTISSNGKVSTWAYGFRYQFQVGYHFGRKKK